MCFERGGFLPLGGIGRSECSFCIFAGLESAGLTVLLAHGVPVSGALDEGALVDHSQGEAIRLRRRRPDEKRAKIVVMGGGLCLIRRSLF